ncbi:RNA methyltransferase [Solibacillus sp. R5-41]|uniref:RNA methyltransferase n=1 Tax=Solibacillus sp. R5-41 TaxID=2048654 RepID=UPI000C126F34|nr:RNA methyltransferase [Solibacillus sp. R5-41]ATP39465.1 RNA methyltransferase [Solibacillus sp. R5-41]
MKKLFPAEPTLKISNAEKIRYNGTYQIRNITTEQYECVIEQFHMNVTGKEIAVQFLQEDGFLLTCKSLQKITIERIQR